MFLKQIFCLGGVYDSPFATDYFVRQYGFMFGGGRSGLMGLKAMQVNKLLRLNHKKIKVGFLKNLGLGYSWKIKPGFWVIVILLCLT